MCYRITINNIKLIRYLFIFRLYMQAELFLGSALLLSSRLVVKVSLRKIICVTYALNKLNPLCPHLKIKVRLVVVSYYRFPSLPVLLRSLQVNFGPRQLVCRRHAWGKALATKWILMAWIVVACKVVSKWRLVCFCSHFPNNMDPSCHIHSHIFFLF